VDGNLKRRILIDLEVSAPTSEDLEYQKTVYDKLIEEADENVKYLYESYGRFLSNIMDPDLEKYQLTAYEIRPAVPGLKYL